MRVERRQAPGGPAVIIVKGHVSGLEGLLDFLEDDLVQYEREDHFLRKIRVEGMPRGRRLNLLVVLEQYPPSPPQQS